MAFTQNSADLSWYESQLLTRAAPTTDATEGVPLHDLKGITIVVQAEATRTLSGAGNLRCYLYDPALTLWFRVPALDLAVNTSGVRQMGFEAESITGKRKATRLLYAADGVTVSAGTTVTVHILGGT